MKEDTDDRVVQLAMCGSEEGGGGLLAVYKAACVGSSLSVSILKLFL